MGDVVAIADEIRQAFESRAGIVALETSVIGQGLPVPRNRECVERMSDAIRVAGGVPAWVGAVDGRLAVGLSQGELARFCEPGAATKVARRDLPVALAGRTPRRDHGQRHDLGRGTRRHRGRGDGGDRRRAPGPASGRER